MQQNMVLAEIVPLYCKVAIALCDEGCISSKKSMSVSRPRKKH
jgi:hypothetical protein